LSIFRAVRFARNAVSAEKYHTTAAARRMGRRGVLLAAAVVPAIYCVALLHLAAGAFLSEYVGKVWASVSVLATDLVVAAIFIWLALKSTPGRDELEAEAIRERALAEVRRSAGQARLLPMALMAAGQSGLLRKLATRLLNRSHS